MIVAITLIFTSVAALTGILAVGRGEHWKFSIPDYFRGKRNAILYLWVVVSTIFSICHSGVIFEYGMSHGWSVHERGFYTWLILHAFMAALLTCAHIFVAHTLSKEVGPVDKYLWGKHRVHEF